MASLSHNKLHWTYDCCSTNGDLNDMNKLIKWIHKEYGEYKQCKTKISHEHIFKPKQQISSTTKKCTGCWPLWISMVLILKQALSISPSNSRQTMGVYCEKSGPVITTGPNRQSGALWEMGLVHCGICTTGLLYQYWCHYGLLSHLLLSWIGQPYPWD